MQRRGRRRARRPARPGRPRRLTDQDRGRIIALARAQPPGRLYQGGEGLLAPAQPKASAHWTLDTLAAAAQAEGVQVARSQVRRILLTERVRWRPTRSWPTSTDPDVAPKRQAHRPLHHPARATTVICADELGPVIPQLPAPTGLVTRRSLHQGAVGVRPWHGQDLGGRRAPRRRRPPGDDDRTVGQQRQRPAIPWLVEQANPAGTSMMITDTCPATPAPRPGPGWSTIPASSTPSSQAGLLAEAAGGWWRLFRREALAGETFATTSEITPTTRVATCRLNARARHGVAPTATVPTPPTASFIDHL